MASRDGKALIKQCGWCSKEFKTYQKYINRGHGKWCSSSCASKYGRSIQPKPQPNTVCAWCDKVFYTRPSRMKNSKSGLRFCNKLCKTTAQRIDGLPEIHPPHYKTGIGGYRGRALYHYPKKCNRCGWDKAVAALVVHHRDHNRNNNDITNLEVLCANCHWTHHLGIKEP